MAIVRCKTSFHLYGRPSLVRAGDLFDSSDPVVQGRENYFEAVEDVVRGAAVEQATAAPGERRSVQRPAKKAPAAKKAAAPVIVGERGPDIVIED